MLPARPPCVCADAPERTEEQSGAEHGGQRQPLPHRGREPSPSPPCPLGSAAVCGHKFLNVVQKFAIVTRSVGHVVRGHEVRGSVGPWTGPWNRGNRFSTRKMPSSLVPSKKKVSTKPSQRNKAHQQSTEGKKLGRWKAIIGFPVSSPSALIKR